MRETYRIKSIFGPTLQGEGSHAGTVVIFLRFAGCNRWTGREQDREKSICGFCDTDFRGGDAMTADEIAAKLQEIGGTKTIVISGGEATLQLDVPLLSKLKGLGYSLHLETNGSNPLLDRRPYFDHVTMSPKQHVHLCQLEECDDLKILYPPIHPEITLEAFGGFKAKNRFLQPVWDKDYEANLRATICRLYGNPSWRLSLQTHKIIGVE